MNWNLLSASRMVHSTVVRLLVATLLPALFPAALAADQARQPAAAAQRPAEQTLADGDWFARQIGQGVIWKHYQFENFHGSPQSISILEADLKTSGVKISLPYLAQDRGRTSEFVPQQVPDAVAAVNATYFDTAGPGGAATFLRINHQIITPTSDRFGSMGIQAALTTDDDGTVRIEPLPEGGWDAYTVRRDVMANGPMLIQDGNMVDFAPFGEHCTNRHPRTMAGITEDSRLILVAVDGRTDQSKGMSCEELAHLMLELGCVQALNLDGGGSTTMWVAGERQNGVVNFPSDNGEYDHLGERPCSNAIAISAPPAKPTPWDARLHHVKFEPAMTAGTTQLVTLEYENIGTRSWMADDVHLVLSRPRTRTSDFYTTGSWVAPRRPAKLDPAKVARGETGRFSFVLSAPEIRRGKTFVETFALVRGDGKRFGPADNEARTEILVYPPENPTTGTVIIESREGGQHYSRYSDTGGWADTGGSASAPGLTPGIGQRYASTFRTRAGTKNATFRPNFAEDGKYKVYVAYGDGGKSAREGVSVKVNHGEGTEVYSVDQTKNANTWVLLGAYRFKAGQEGSVVVTNENLNVSGNMFIAAVKFEPVEGDGK